MQRGCLSKVSQSISVIKIASQVFLLATKIEKRKTFSNLNFLIFLFVFPFILFAESLSEEKLLNCLLLHGSTTPNQSHFEWIDLNLNFSDTSFSYNFRDKIYGNRLITSEKGNGFSFTSSFRLPSSKTLIIISWDVFFNDVMLEWTFRVVINHRKCMLSLRLEGSLLLVFVFRII